MIRKKNEYITIKLPKAIVDKIDEYVKNNPVYTSRTDLSKEVFRRFFNQI